MSAASLESSLASKEAGNEHYKKKRYPEAIKCYTDAINSCPKEARDERLTFLKNRAACYLQVSKYSEALGDTTAVLELAPSDVKALYRHTQALESLERLSEAFKYINILVRVDPKNKEAEAVARRLTAKIKREAESRQSTDHVVQEMYSVLEGKETKDDKKMKAAKNLAILSRENAGAEQIYKSGGVAKIASLLTTAPPDIVHHLLQTLVGLCSTEAHSQAVLEVLTFDRLTSIICRPEKEVCGSGVAVLKQALLSQTDAGSSLVKDIVGVGVSLLGRQEMSADARDRMLELVVSSVSQVSFAKYLKFPFLLQCTFTYMYM